MTDLARALADARRIGAALAEAPAPMTLAEGYAVAERVVTLLGTPIGWKIGATSADAMAVLGVAEPIRGRVFADGVLESGAVFNAGARPVAVEPEIVLYPAADGQAARARLALEIVRPSRDDALALGAGFIVADNAAHVALVLGPELAINALHAAIPVTLSVAGVVRETGDTAAVLGDPRAALAWLAGAVGPALGDGPVATGAITRAVEVGAGETVVADFGEYGRVVVRMAPTPN